MKVTIQRADNGYILFYDDVTEDAQPVVRYITIEEDDDLPYETSDIRAFARLTWELMDVLGIHNSKHKPERLKIEIEAKDGD